MQFEEEYLKGPLKDCRLEDMALKPKKNDMRKLVASRILSVLICLLCLLVLATEATALIHHESSVVYWVKLYF